MQVRRNLNETNVSISSMSYLTSKIFHVIFIAKGITDNCEAGYAMLKCFKADGNEFWFK